MEDYLKKKKVREALKKAKELEKEKLLTPKQEVELQREAVSFSERLRKMLKPAWFVSDVHKKKTSAAASKKSRTKAKRKKAKKKKTKKKKSGKKVLKRGSGKKRAVGGPSSKKKK